MLKSYIEKRVKFLNKKEQRKFIEMVKQKIPDGIKGIAKVSKVSVRQISDWKNGKSSLSLYAFEKLLTVTKIPRPVGIEIIDLYSHASSAGKKGFIAVLKKYGQMPKDEKYRRENWYKWWESEGKYQKREIFKRMAIKIPERSEGLAELCGIVIGDGGITKRQVKITLNCETDKAYSRYVIKLLQKLFKVTPKIHKIKNNKAINICISRSDLVDFLVKQGLKLGNKLEQDLSVPNWIIRRQKYLLLCIRGMIDTDGCVVRETHTIKNKKYVYYRLNFTSASPTLVKQTTEALRALGFHPKIRRKGRSVQLENMAEIWEYFKRIGTSNPKHMNKLRRSGSSG